MLVTQIASGIIGGSMILTIITGLAVNYFDVLPDDPFYDAVMHWALWGIYVIGLDTFYRTNNYMSPFDIDDSTIFFVVPTWVFGVGICVYTGFAFYTGEILIPG